MGEFMEYINSKTINRILCFTLLIFSCSLIFVVFKYVGIINILTKIIKSLVPVIFAIFLSFLLEPFIEKFLRIGIKRKYSVLFVYIFILIVIFLLLYLTIPSLIDQISVFINKMPDLLSVFFSFINKLQIPIDEEKFSATINNFFIDFSKSFINYVSSSFSVFFSVLLGVSGAIFLSFDYDRFKIKAKDYIPKKINKPVIFYFKNLFPFVHKYFVGMLIDSVFIFIISSLAFLFIDIDYVLVLALIIAVTNLIPIIGPYIGGIPAVLVGLSVSPKLGISALIVVLIIQLIESNFIQPFILKNAIKLHPLEGILGISLFGSLFGVIGMILSPILMVALKCLFIPYDEEIVN